MEIDKDKQLTEIEGLITKHSDRLRYHQGFGSPAERVETLLQHYADETASAYRNTSQFRDDMLTYFRALIIILDMTGNAATHAEKNARLRGAIELLERMVEELRRKDVRVMFSGSRWRDAFASDWPTRGLLDRIHNLEAELSMLKQLPAQAEQPPSEDVF